MNGEQIQRIRASFATLAPHADAAMTAFYERLFEEHPGVRPLFPDDMTAQKKHLAAAIGLVVKHAEHLDAIAHTLRDMGVRHAGYGACPEHYGVVRDTLLTVLGESAGDAWSDTLRDDWADALNAVAARMLEGAEGAEGAGRAA